MHVCPRLQNFGRRERKPASKDTLDGAHRRQSLAGLQHASKDIMLATLVGGLVPGSRLHCSGRSAVTSAGVRLFDFPGTSIAARIHGSSAVSAVINETGTNRYAVSIDGGTTWLEDTVNTTAGQHEYVLCNGLSKDDSHDLVLLKLTEACSAVFGCSWGDFGTCSLIGMRLDSEEASILPPQRFPWQVDQAGVASRRLEFIGDSITAAWGARADASARDDATCSLAEDARSSWAHQTARRLRAEAHLIAWGGVGLVINDDACMRPAGAAAPTLWRRAIANDPESEWQAESWLPHAVLIHLGTNDLCCGNEKKLSHASFEQAYVDFICQIVAARSGTKQAPVHFFLACGPMGNSKGNHDHTGREFYFPCSVIQRVAAAVNSMPAASSSSSALAAEVHAHVLDFSGLMDEQACIGGCSHPSERCHALMAEKAAQKMSEVLGWR